MFDTGRMWKTFDGGLFIILNKNTFIWHNTYTKRFDFDSLDDTIENLDPEWIEVL